MKGMLADCLRIEKGITSIIGSGGKTTLMLGLAGELAERGRVIICTSTKIEKPEDIPVIDQHVTCRAIEKAFETTSVVCVGSRFKPANCESEGYYKLSAPAMGFRELAGIADYVLVEADGSRRLPLKAHESHEPVIPGESQRLIGVVGISGIGRKLCEAVHRKEVFAQILEETMDIEGKTARRMQGSSLKSPCAGTERRHRLYEHPVTPEMVAEVINFEYSGFSEQGFGLPVIVINQADTDQELKLARELAGGLNYETWAGSVREGRLVKL